MVSITASKGQEKVLALCRAVGADTYINAIGGTELYSREEFGSQGVELKFISSKPYRYGQFGVTFVRGLSIIDVLMFHSLDVVREYIVVNREII